MIRPALVSVCVVLGFSVVACSGDDSDGGQSDPTRPDAEQCSVLRDRITSVNDALNLLDVDRIEVERDELAEVYDDLERTDSPLASDTRQLIEGLEATLRAQDGDTPAVEASARLQRGSSGIAITCMEVDVEVPLLR